jgi:hypothetical protein
MPPNFVLLDASLPDIARLLIAMVQARNAVESRSWSHPQEPTTEEWWADVLADPRARTPKRRSDYTGKQAFYRLADELRDTILVACSKCDWKAAFRRDELITAQGAVCPLPSLSTLPPLAAPRSARNGTAAACITSSPSSAVSEAAKLKGRAHVTARYVRRAAHGYEPTREAAMAAFAKSWRRE